jgi:tetratricopeptide (TPR) repeat protein
MTRQSRDAVKASLLIEQALSQAIAHHQGGGLKEAEGLYRAILQVQPQHPVANHNLGVLAVQVKQPAAGLAHFKVALDANPNQGQYWISYIDALMQTGQVDDARRVLEQGRQAGLQGDAVEALAQKLDAPSLAEMNDLAALFNQGRYAEGEAMARAMTEQFPDHGFGWKVLGAILHKLERLEEALQVKERATLLMPDDAEAHNNIGHTLQELDRFSDAESSLRRALALNPNHASAYNNLGLTLQKMGRLDEAEVSLRQALALHPSYAEAHNNLGITLEKKDRLADAEASYRQALKIKPDCADAYKNLGNVFLSRKMMNDAIACYEHAIAIAPDYEAAHNNLGAVYFASGQTDRALLCYQKALELKPSFANASYNIGTAFYQQGNISAAMDCFRKTLTLKHDNWVADAAAYLAVLCYLTGDIAGAMEVIGEFKGELAHGDAKLGAYFSYLDLLISSGKKAVADIDQPSDEVLYVMGESHSLSLHRIQVVFKGKVKTCHSKWILGCKQWHLGSDEANSYKHKFELEMARFPRQSTILLTIGEIDCRPDEGILKAWKKFPDKSLDEVAHATVTRYVRYVAGIAARYGHQIIVGGVPATNIPLNALAEDITEQLVRLIRVFNAMLKDQALAAGMDFLDVYELTDRGDGTASGQWHIDDVHLTPDAMVEAFNVKERRYGALKGAAH